MHVTKDNEVAKKSVDGTVDIVQSTLETYLR